MASRIPSSPPVFSVDSTGSRRSSESSASPTVSESEDSSDEAKILQAKNSEEKIADDLAQKIAPREDKGKEKDESIDLSSSSTDSVIIDITPQTPSTKNVSSSPTTTVGTIVAAPPAAAPGGPALLAPAVGPVPPPSYRLYGGSAAASGLGCGIIFMSFGLSNSSVLFSAVGGVFGAIGVAGMGYCLIPEISRLRVWMGHVDPT